MESSYSRAQKDEALEAFRKQLENGAVVSGEMQELSKRLNIGVSTLYAWKVAFKKKLMSSGEFQPEASKFSSNDKFQAVVDTNSLSELELGEYLRTHGILRDELESWRTTLHEAFNKSSSIASELSKELAKEKSAYKELQKELRRKERALAETAALLVLQKKAQAIWGEPGDD